MPIRVNGKHCEVAPGITITGLLAHLNLDGRQLVVEHNRQIVPHQQYSERVLRDGDCLEIIHFVGGG